MPSSKATAPSKPKRSQVLASKAQRVQAQRAKLEAQLATITTKMSKLDADLNVILRDVVAAI